MDDLFRYPSAAGHKARDTAKAAADATPAVLLRQRVLDVIERSNGMTADECAGRMGLSILSVRPRFSELARLGKVRDSGERRANNSGRKAIVWLAGAAGAVEPAVTTWRERAHAYIATLDIPVDVTLKQCRRIFRDNGGRFHGGTYWGRKAWGKACREFQTKRGLLPPKPYTPAAPHLFAADITFPFRSKENDHVD